MRVALLIVAGLAALCPPASGQAVFSRPYEPNQIAVEAIICRGGPLNRLSCLATPLVRTPG